MTGNAYYAEKRFVAGVDRNDTVTGPVERWQAHREGLLHRGFTVILIHETQVLLQQRKHPAFDGVLDLTFSSHPVYRGGTLQSDEEAIVDALEREWSLTAADFLGKPVRLGSVYYRAKDPKSVYIEHEVDIVYRLGIRRLPVPNPDYAYGFHKARYDRDHLLEAFSGMTFAPWVEGILREISL